MERPAHLSLHASQNLSTRLVLFGLAVLLPAVMAWALGHGGVAEAIRDFTPLVVDHVKDPVKPALPPPEPVLQRIEPLTVIQPVITIAPDQREERLTTTVPVQPKQETVPMVAAGPDRAVAGVMSTHTIPPYPALAQRLGEEGNVTLRLTVLADGRVAKADIVNSSGSAGLDQAAQKWIVAHWIYKPALEKGQPVPSQTSVTVNFNLKDQH